MSYSLLYFLLANADRSYHIVIALESSSFRPFPSGIPLGMPDPKVKIVCANGASCGILGSA